MGVYVLAAGPQAFPLPPTLVVQIAVRVVCAGAGLRVRPTYCAFLSPLRPISGFPC